ncbi:hypothetical protein [Leucobacter massiliensis]|uniref:hypothetical protein n=1 Tax=Leucobacter massiliensis TaxID=1686285 RepID=UPI0011B236D4|nr:hypothetical protein [Leucobacter massiliensis]
MLQKALTDYEGGHYYSTALVVFSMMDGFVKDLDRATRQGLHTRPAEDMVAWDSVAGHHLGLSHAHQSFLKGFYKTDETRVTELFRNGIMHGTLVNFDNDVVATKAWNRLFAVADWADSRERRAKSVDPTPPPRVSLRQWKDVQARESRIEEWEPYEHEPEPNAEELPEVGQTSRYFLKNWEKQRWGLVGKHFMELGSPQSAGGKLAVLAKELYEELELSAWTILRVRHVAAAVAHTDVELFVNGAM